MKISNRNIFKRTLLMSGALIMGFAATSCGSFIGPEEGDGYTIVNTTTKLSENGDSLLVLEFSNDKPPLNIRIPKGVDGTSIKDVVYKTKDGIPYLTFVMDDDGQTKKTFALPIKGIKDIEIKSEDEAGNQTIVYTYLDNTTQTITIPKGKDGLGIKKIEVNEEDNAHKITISYDDESLEPVEFYIDDARSIDTVEYNEGEDPYTYDLKIIYSDGTDETLNVKKPYTNKWLRGNTEPSNDEDSVKNAKIGDFYLNVVNGNVYALKDDNSWEFLLCMKSSNSDESSKHHFVTFNVNGGKFINSKDGAPGVITIDVIHGNSINLSRLPKPVKDGYEFDGWFTDLDNVNAGQLTDLTIITKEITVYAKYSEIKK